jgi:predicted secreted protein
MITLLVVVLIAAFAGCAASAPKTFGEKDTTIAVDEGQTFVIRLVENPTTGYQWSHVIADEGIIQFTKEEYKADSQDTNLVGGGGIKDITFKAAKKGTTTITLTNERSWEQNPDDKKIVYNVEVK